MAAVLAVYRHLDWRNYSTRFVKLKLDCRWSRTSLLSPGIECKYFYPFSF